MTSNVGNSQVYADGDQRKHGESDANGRERFNEGVPNSHLPHDSKDQRTIKNRLAREEKNHDEPDPISEENFLSKQDSTLPARAHGNKPSKGAKIDQQLREEEEEELKKKGSWGPAQ